MTGHELSQSASNLPVGTAIFLDHIGFFVADPEAATAALRDLGFAPTPQSVQVNPDPAGGAPKLTGTGNVCAMLRAGYLEVLFQTADTPLGREHRDARARYEGLHLVAFATSDAEREHRRLAAAGFQLQPVVNMQRPVETETGPDVAAFGVVRLLPGQMPEGRVQMLVHKTERTVWQPRWLDQPNGAVGLTGLTIVVADVGEAAARFARFTGRPAEPVAGTDTRRIALDRGYVELQSAQDWQRCWPSIAVPSLPFMGACEIEVASLERTHAWIAAHGMRLEPSGPNERAVRIPAALGHGVMVFSQR